MKANQLTGTDCFSARTHIGISVSAVAKLTQINRNTLSDFEKEKGTITLMQKRALIAFYEERGYDFDESETPDLDMVVENYEEAHTDAEHAIETLPIEVTSTIESLKDSFHDLVVAHGYLEAVKNREEQEKESQESEGSYFYFDSENNEVLFAEFEKGQEELKRHFALDSKGETRSDIGFLTSKTNRASSLVSMLAIQQLRSMTLQGNDYTEALLSGDNGSEKLGVDGKCIIDVINTCLERGDALDLEGFDSLGIDKQKEN